MTRQDSLRTIAIKTRIFAALAPFVAALTILVALAAAQHAGQLSASNSASAASPSGGPPLARLQSPGLPRSADAGPDQAVPSVSALSFEPPVTYPLPGGYSMSAAVGDVNGDGIPDIIVISGIGSPNGDGLVSVLLGNGDGTFQPATSFDSAGGFPDAVISADVNNDGKLDIVVANCSSTAGLDCPGSDGVLAVFLGNGDGTFQSPITISTGGPPAWQMAVADVNLDGNLDAVVGTDGEGPSSFWVTVTAPFSHPPAHWDTAESRRL